MIPIHSKILMLTKKTNNQKYLQTPIATKLNIINKRLVHSYAFLRLLFLSNIKETSFFKLHTVTAGIVHQPFCINKKIGKS